MSPFYSPGLSRSPPITARNTVTLLSAAVVGLTIAAFTEQPLLELKDYNSNLVWQATGSGITTQSGASRVRGTMSGWGPLTVSNLISCDTIDTNAGGVLACGTDADTGGGGAGTFGTGNVLTIGDARYVDQSGDTMTGSLRVDVSGGDPNSSGLGIVNTGSGRHFHAEQGLTSSGTASIEGASVLQSTLAVTSTVTFSNLTSCNTIDSDSSGVLSCGTDEGSSSTNTGNVLDIGEARWVNVSGDTMTGNLIIGNASTLSVSGTILTEANTLTLNDDDDASNITISFINSGTDETFTWVEATDLFELSDDLWVLASTNVTGHLSGGSLFAGRSFSGAGLTDCNTNNRDRVQWDANEEFSCDTDQISLTADVTGVLPIANGGTNASAAVVQGALIFADADSYDYTAAGSSGQTIVSRGTATPEWKEDVRTLVFVVGGQVATGSGGGAIVLPWGCTIRNEASSLDMVIAEAPTGSSLIVDIEEDQTSIFTTRPEIDAGAYVEDGNHTFVDTDLDKGDLITLDVDQIGSTLSGTGMSIMLSCNRHP